MWSMFLVLFIAPEEDAAIDIYNKQTFFELYSTKIWGLFK